MIYLCYKLFVVYPEAQSWCLDCTFLVTLSQGSSTFPFGEVEAGLKTETMDGESFWYYLIRPPLLTHLWHREILGCIEALLVTGPEHPYSVAINSALWSSQGLVPTCLFKQVSRGSSHKTIFPAALPLPVLLWAPGSEGRPGTHNVPEEVGQPVGGGAHATDKLQVLGFRHPLLDQVKDKAGWNEGHGENHTYGNDDIHGSGQPAAGPERGNIRDPGKAHRRLRQSLPLGPHPQHEAHRLTGLS